MIAVLGALALFAGPAAASKTYTNATDHWQLTVPDTWNWTESSHGVSFEDSPLATWAFSGASQPNASAADTDAFVLAAATEDCDQTKGALGGTYATAPHALMMAGRHAGECVIDYSLPYVGAYRIHVVGFASDGYDTIYVLSVNDNASQYAGHQSAYDAAFASFKVQDEPAGNMGGTSATGSSSGMLSGTMLYLVIALVVVVVVGGAAVMMRKGKGKKADQQAAPGQRPPAQPPAK